MKKYFIFLSFFIITLICLAQNQNTIFKVTNYSPAVMYISEASSIMVQFKSVGDSYARFYSAWIRMDDGRYINLYSHNCTPNKWMADHCCGEVVSGMGEVTYNLEKYIKTPFTGQFIFAVSSFVGYWDVNIIFLKNIEQTSNTSPETYKNVFQGVSPESIKAQTFFERMKLLKQDLEQHDVKRVFFYFDQKHMQININNLMNNKFQFIEQSLNSIIWGWGFIEDNYKNRITNIKDIKAVIEFKIFADKVVFVIRTIDGIIHTLYAYINWENLTIYGASG